LPLDWVKLLSQSEYLNLCHIKGRECGLTKKAEPPPTRGVSRDSGTASAIHLRQGYGGQDGGWLRRLVRWLVSHLKIPAAREPSVRPQTHDMSAVENRQTIMVAQSPDPSNPFRDTLSGSPLRRFANSAADFHFSTLNRGRAEKIFAKNISLGAQLYL